MNEIIRYIIEFLTRNSLSETDLQQIGYTADIQEFSNYKIVIRSSSFFDSDIYATPKSLPHLPLKLWEKTPLLFGEPSIEKNGKTLIINADIVASSFFLFSRYEEIVNKNRDEHGRFAGKNSLPYHAAFIHRPIVDEYAETFCKILKDSGFNIQPKTQTFNKIYLTHDVDMLTRYRNLCSVFGAIIKQKGVITALKSYFGTLEDDPFYTFPMLFEKTKNKKQKTRDGVEQICFILNANKQEKNDKTNYSFKSKDFRKFLKLCAANEVKIGLHTSYAAGKSGNLKQEKEKLESVVNQKITKNRHHFLALREPSDFLHLIEAGITDDFTMGYADIAGFRLGTCRAVRFINPLTRTLTPLNLHPLSIMDCTLGEEKYMNLFENQAFEYAKILIDNTKHHCGDLCLLWHNTSLCNAYYKNLYENIINYISVC